MKPAHALAQQTMWRQNVLTAVSQSRDPSPMANCVECDDTVHASGRCMCRDTDTVYASGRCMCRDTDIVHAGAVGTARTLSAANSTVVWYSVELLRAHAQCNLRAYTVLQRRYSALAEIHLRIRDRAFRDAITPVPDLEALVILATFSTPLDEVAPLAMRVWRYMGRTADTYVGVGNVYVVLQEYVSDRTNAISALESLYGYQTGYTIRMYEYLFCEGV